MSGHQKQWGVAVSGAIARRDNFKKQAKLGGPPGRLAFAHYRRLGNLLCRFENGERTDKLYDLLIEVF